ncbi:alpha/beta hydrolase family protein [Gordonia sp. NPDC003376]
MTSAMLGRVYVGAADTGETLATIDRIVDGDVASWVAEWEALADRIAALAESSLQGGHRVSARNTFLRAATYYTPVILMVDGLDNPDTVLKRTFSAYRRCWEQYLSLLDNPPEAIEIPYGESTMPGWFFASSSSGPAKTIILANGADGATSYLYPGYGLEAATRGYNVILFDGPGQQRMLFERGVPFRHDWENVLGPVLDYALTRPEVDRDRIVLYAVSQGGFWAPRTLAFEHRFQAAVIDGGVTDVSVAWRGLLGPDRMTMVEDGDDQRLTTDIENLPPAARRMIAWRTKPYGKPNVREAYEAVLQYRITPELAGRITTPVLIANPDDEGYFAGQPAELYEMIPGDKEIVHFTAADGAAGHCEPMARGLAATRFFDFLDDHVA